jgi:hypothetical protein
MKKMVAQSLVWSLALVLPGAAQQVCEAAAAAPALDHVVVVVRDLDAAAAAFRAHGFRIKPGRLHANNLLNRHIKFRDGTEVELMTVAGRPGDAMAQDYADLSAAGEGGVYVALGSGDIAVADSAARVAGLETRHSTSGAWRFLSFPPNSPAAAVFFASGVGAVRDPDSLVAHVPAVDGLAEAWLEGGAALAELLARLGATRCGDARAPDGRTGQRWALRSGSVVIVPPRGALRPRVLGVVLRSGALRDLVTFPYGGFWVRYER